MENQNIPQKIERLAALYPDHIIANDECKSITYGNLNRRSSLLANLIVSMAGSELCQIAYFIDHGIDQLIAMYAILKAGKCYIPLDINFPSERNKFCLEDSESLLLIVNNHTRDKALELISPDKMINLDEIPADTLGNGLNIDFPADRRAAIYYTSGSSGKPKGVIYTHDSLISSVFSWQFTGNDVILNVFPCSFAIHHIPVFGALLNNANVSFFDIRKHGLSEMKTYFLRKKISICITVTSVFRQLLDTLTDNESGFFRYLKTVVTTGDPLYRNDVLNMRSKISDSIRIVNVYGSTETTAAAFCEVNNNILQHDSIIPVGHPPQNMEISIYDENGSICGGIQDWQITPMRQANCERLLESCRTKSSIC